MVTVVYCTRETNPEHKEHLIKSSGLHKHIEVIEIINNGESLTSAYNRGLKQAKNDIVVFCHDDLTIETKQWGNKLVKQFQKNPDYGIIGVAGTKNMPVSGQWWENRKKMYGRVAHTHEGKTWLSSYSEDQGRELQDVVVVDGVFFAIDKTKIKVDFNETVEGFHFYDINFCFENHLKGVKIGVSTLIRVNHKSIGATNQSWDDNRKIFAETFKDKLPVTLKKTFYKGQKVKVLVGCLSSDENVLSLIEKLKKDDCEVSVVTNVQGTEPNLKKLGVKIYRLQEPPGFKLGDGKWLLNTTEGQTPSQENTLYKIVDIDFDVLHLIGKPIADHLLRLYPDTDAVCSIDTTNKSTDEPVKSEQIKKYIAANDEVKDVLIEGYGIDESLVTDEIEDYKLILS